MGSLEIATIVLGWVGNLFGHTNMICSHHEIHVFLAKFFNRQRDDNWEDEEDMRAVT